MTGGPRRGSAGRSSWPAVLALRGGARDDRRRPGDDPERCVRDRHRVHALHRLLDRRRADRGARARRTRSAGSSAASAPSPESRCSPPATLRTARRRTRRRTVGRLAGELVVRRAPPRGRLRAPALPGRPAAVARAGASSPGSAALGIAAFTIGVACKPGPLGDYHQVTNPVGVDHGVAQALQYGGVVLVVSPSWRRPSRSSLRYRGADELGRQQIKLLVAAAVFTACCTSRGRSSASSAPSGCATC